MIETLREDFRALDTGRKRLRQFGLAVGMVLALIALAIAWRGGWTMGAGPLWLVAAGAALVVLGLVAPALLRPVYRAWMGLALVLGHVMTRVLLGIVFFLVVTPIGLLRRAVGRDALEKSPTPVLESYWIGRDADTSRERLERYW